MLTLLFIKWVIMRWLTKKNTELCKLLLTLCEPAFALVLNPHDAESPGMVHIKNVIS